jgi:hypothetical protein
MKNTLLAVLITTVCYDRIQAQRLTPQVINNAVNAGIITDGAASTDKLASDIFTTNKLVDGVLSMNKLADDIINSQTIIDDVAMPGGQQLAPTTLFTQYSTTGEQWSYARYVQHLLLPDQIQKPRPVNTKRTG